MLDIERTVRKLLADTLDVSATVDVPADRPDSFVTVECTGGNGADGIVRPTVVVRSWAHTRTDASALARLADSVIRGALTGDPITYASGTVPAQIAVDGRHHVYQSTYDLVAHDA